MLKVFALVFATLTMALLCSAPAAVSPGLHQHWSGARVPLWVLLVPSVRLRALRLLRTRLVCWRRVYWSGPLVPWPCPLLRPCR